VLELQRCILLFATTTIHGQQQKQKDKLTARTGRKTLKGKEQRQAIDPPVPSPKSHPKPHLKCRSVPLEPDIVSAENESDALLAATEGLLGLSKAGKTHDGGASEVEDSNGSSTPSDMDVDGRGVAIDLDEDDKTSKSSDSDGKEEDEGKLFISSVMMMD